jgi:metal-sulfur cluster biosynthetic enzyme
MSDQKSANEKVLEQLKEQAAARAAAKAAESPLKISPPINLATAERNEKILAWIHPVQDPEMLISVVDLGLVYEAKFDEAGKKAEVTMTLTSAGCPLADVFMNSVKTRLLEYPGVETAEVKLVFEPKWDPQTMASDEVKDKMGIW